MTMKKTAVIFNTIDNGQIKMTTSEMVDAICIGDN